MVNSVMPPMPPPGMGGAPPMPPGIAGPMGGPPEPPPLEPPDTTILLLEQIEQMVDVMGADEVRDMMSALPPDLLEELYTLIDEDVRAAIVLGDLLDPPEREPAYEPWYQPTKKPTKSEILDAITEDEGRWQVVATRIREDIRWYHGEKPNTFRNFDHKQEDYFLSMAIRNDSDTKIAILGNTPITFQIPFTEMELEDATQKAENFLYYILQCWKSQFAKSSGGRDVRHDIEWYREVTGWVFYECALDLRGGKPFSHRLHDPTTCTPAWDEYGLARFTRIYWDSVENVIAAYDTDGSVRKKLLSKQFKGQDGQTRSLHLDDYVTVKYYIDRTWRALYVDDVEVISPVKHKYGCVPVVVGGSGLGEPMNFYATSGFSGLPDPVAGDIQMRLEYKNPSGFHHLKRLHAQKEAVLTQLFNMAARMNRPDWLVEQDEYAESEGTPSVKRGGNAVTSIKKGHESLTPLLETVGGDFFDPLVGAIANEDLTSRLPLSQYGVSDTSQQSGNAVEGHIESGKEKFAVQLQAGEVMWGEIASLWLRLYRDHGHLIPNERGEYGRTRVPYGTRDRWRNPKRPSAFDLTPEMLDHVGIEVEAKMTALRMQNLGPLGNAVGVWMSNKGMSAREAMEMRGVRDPDLVFEEMDYEEILFDPEIKKLKKLKLLRERDPELALLYEKSIMAASKPPQQSPMGVGAGGPMQPNTSAMDLTAIGQGTPPPGGGADGVDVPPGVIPAPGPGSMIF